LDCKRNPLFQIYLALEFPVAKNSLVPIASIKDLASSHHGPRVSKAKCFEIEAGRYN
jgi:hypothetical protein